MLMPSVSTMIAAGVVPRSSSSTARMPPPSRVLSPLGAERADFLDDAGHVLLPAGPHAGEKIDPQLVPLGDAAQQRAVVLGQQRPQRGSSGSSSPPSRPLRFNRVAIALRGLSA